MLTYQDCIGLCDLTDEEVEAIAEHEHVPDIVAAELGSYLVHSDTGTPMIKRIIIDDIQHARDQGHTERVLHLELVLKHFVATHPERSAAA